jgi:hypothetical protein
MAAWLLEKRVRGFGKGPKISERRLLSQSPSFIPCMATMYSLSVVVRETISCCLDDQETALPSMRNA